MFIAVEKYADKYVYVSARNARLLSVWVFLYCILSSFSVVVCVSGQIQVMEMCFFKCHVSIYTVDDQTIQYETLIAGYSF